MSEFEPDYGYGMPIKDILHHLEPVDEELLQDLVESGDHEHALDFYNIHRPAGWPKAYRYMFTTDEDILDVLMSPNEMYLMFEERELYTKVPTVACRAIMSQLRAPPDLLCWADWNE